MTNKRQFNEENFTKGRHRYRSISKGQNVQLNKKIEKIKNIEQDVMQD